MVKGKREMDFKKFNHPGVYVFGVGGILSVLTGTAFQPSPEALEKMNYVSQFLYSYKDSLNQFSNLLAVGGFLWFSLNEVINETLKQTVADGFVGIADALNKGMVGIRRGKMVLSVIETLSVDEAKKLIMPVLRKVYGEHISYSGTNVGGYVERQYLKYLDSTSVYKEGQKRTIKVGDDSGNLSWEEHHTYQLKYPAMGLSENAPTKKFKLPYAGGLRLPDGMEQKDFLSLFRLRICVDGKQVFDVAECVEDGLVKEECKPYLSIEKSGDELLISYFYEFDITKETTEVKIDERSIFDINDDSFTLITYEPVHNLTMSMSLPRGWEIHRPLISANKLAGRDSERPKLWSYWPDEECKNQLHVDIPDWVMPGVVLGCNWTVRDNKGA